MKEPFFAWPGWPYLRFAWLLSAANGAWFAIVYGGCNWITAHRQWRVPISLPIELSIPLVPWTVLLYMSIYLVFLIGPLIIRDPCEFTATIRSLCLTILVAGLGFLLVPSRNAYSPPGDVGIWTGLLHSARSVALEYNMVPSLHVALSVCCIAIYARHAAATGRFLLWSWAVAIAFSTLLTHQHHVLDVVTGWLLGMAASLPRNGFFHVHLRPVSDPRRGSHIRTPAK